MEKGFRERMKKAIFDETIAELIEIDRQNGRKSHFAGVRTEDDLEKLPNKEVRRFYRHYHAVLDGMMPW